MSVPGGMINKVLYKKTPPRGSTPYPFIYPFRILLVTNGTPFRQKRPKKFLTLLPFYPLQIQCFYYYLFYNIEALYFLK